MLRTVREFNRSFEEAVEEADFGAISMFGKKRREAITQLISVFPEMSFYAHTGINTLFSVCAPEEYIGK